MLTRRQFTAVAAASVVALTLPRRARAAEPERWLLFTKSSGFIHDVIKPDKTGETFLGKALTPLFEQRGLKLVESKDGTLFEPESLKTFAGVVFYTTGDLTTPGQDGQPPMSPIGKQALLDAVAAGKPFIGLHCASDTFGTPKDGQPDAFIRMLGGEFDGHGKQQQGTAKIVDLNFPGIGDQRDWTFVEEWYALKHLAPDLHAIHVLETRLLDGDEYKRAPHPITWTRLHEKGRIFYTAIGHREDVITGKAFQGLIGGAIDWCRKSEK